jgi:hypothetical protein
MTDIVVTADRVSALDPLKALIKSYVAAVAILKGDAVYITTTGTVGKCDANDSGKYQFRGIALKAAAAGEITDVLQDGEVAGFAVSGLNVDARVYVSNTAGKLADAAGTVGIVAGRVSILTDQPTYTKVLRIFTQWEADWS